MDGYALRAADRRGPLRVVGESAAGRGFRGRCGPGEAVRIFTGAPLPDGADTVLIRKSRAATAISSPRPRRSGRPQCARRRRRFPAGDDDLRAGRRLAPPMSRSPPPPTIPRCPWRGAARRRAGHRRRARARRSARPRPDRPSNSFARARAGRGLRRRGARPRHGRRRLDAIEAAIAARAPRKLTFSSPSAAPRSATAISCAARWPREGMELSSGRSHEAGKAADPRPYRPDALSACPATRFRPPSAANCSCVRSSARCRATKTPGRTATGPALAGTDLPAGGSRREYLRATLAFDAEGRVVATPQADQDSSLTTVLAYSEALILREEKASPCKKGEALRILRLRTERRIPGSTPETDRGGGAFPWTQPPRCFPCRVSR